MRSAIRSFSHLSSLNVRSCADHSWFCVPLFLLWMVRLDAQTWTDCMTEMPQA